MEVDCWLYNKLYKALVIKSIILVHAKIRVDNFNKCHKLSFIEQIWSDVVVSQKFDQIGNFYLSFSQQIGYFACVLVKHKSKKLAMFLNNQLNAQLVSFFLSIKLD